MNFFDAYSDRAVLTVPEAARWANICRSKLYMEINAGRLRPTKIGRKTVFRKDDLLTWFNGLQSENRRAA
ncbi:helix-turn-helix domain-containing protein [Mesorhizobium sp. DCY119]|uniref:helix-turn-helix domain-containing protein n=1 Tax=Mesorhizobium sp. DCY119 TaxID=2108445 RepID=UPI000E6BBCA6|nr:helix-turn-helix domain-containing protein [Mesorhizobium sp. DCY119]RJG43731.1 DNA-binding protein [Mesorhizobium sp. DCY119]